MPELCVWVWCSQIDLFRRSEPDWEQVIPFFLSPPRSSFIDLFLTGQEMRSRDKREGFLDSLVDTKSGMFGKLLFSLLVLKLCFLETKIDKGAKSKERSKKRKFEALKAGEEKQKDVASDQHEDTTAPKKTKKFDKVPKPTRNQVSTVAKEEAPRAVAMVDVDAQSSKKKKKNSKKASGSARRKKANANKAAERAAKLQ